MVVGRRSLVIEIDKSRVNESWLDSRRPTSRRRELDPPYLIATPREATLDRYATPHPTFGLRGSTHFTGGFAAGTRGG